MLVGSLILHVELTGDCYRFWAEINFVLFSSGRIYPWYFLVRYQRWTDQHLLGFIDSGKNVLVSTTKENEVLFNSWKGNQ